MLDPPGPKTALWSIPGSGNYWTRYLIQKTTGYMTGTNLKEQRTSYFLFFLNP